MRVVLFSCLLLSLGLAQVCTTLADCPISNSTCSQFDCINQTCVETIDDPCFCGFSPQFTDISPNVPVFSSFKAISVHQNLLAEVDPDGVTLYLQDPINLTHWVQVDQYPLNSPSTIFSAKLTDTHLIVGYPGEVGGLVRIFPITSNTIGNPVVPLASQNVGDNLGYSLETITAGSDRFLFVGSPGNRRVLVIDYSNPASFGTVTILSVSQGFGFTIAATTTFVVIGAPTTQSNLGQVFFYVPDYSGKSFQPASSIQGTVPGQGFGFSVERFGPTSPRFAISDSQGRVSIYTGESLDASDLLNSAYTELFSLEVGPNFIVAIVDGGQVVAVSNNGVGSVDEIIIGEISAEGALAAGFQDLYFIAQTDSITVYNPNFGPSLCQDFDPCTENVCINGACSFEPIPNCCLVDSDCGDACTISSCGPDQQCSIAPLNCSDNNHCTIDSCDPIQGCVYEPVVCPDDGNACSINQCDPANGQCVAIPIMCDDNDPCTNDSCDSLQGCIYEPIVCQETDACGNPSVCQTGVCVPQPPPDTACLDGNYSVIFGDLQTDTTSSFATVDNERCLLLGGNSQSLIELGTAIDVSAGPFSFGFDFVVTNTFSNLVQGNLTLPSASGCVLIDGFNVCFQQEPVSECANQVCALSTDVCGSFDLVSSECGSGLSNSSAILSRILIQDTVARDSGFLVCLNNFQFGEALEGPPVDQGCVYSPGYWSMNYQSCQVLSGHPIVFADLTTDQLWAQSPAGGNAWVILVRQYLGAVFNLNCADESNPTNVSQLLFEIAEFIDDTEYQIFPQNPNRQQAVEYASILDNYNNGKAGVGSCPLTPGSFAGSGKSQEDEEILNALERYEPGLFDWAYQRDSETGLPSKSLNPRGGLAVAGLAVLGLAGLAVVGVLMIRRRKQSQNDLQMEEDPDDLLM